MLCPISGSSAQRSAPVKSVPGIPARLADRPGGSTPRVRDGRLLAPAPDVHLVAPPLVRVRGGPFTRLGRVGSEIRHGLLRCPTQRPGPGVRCGLARRYPASALGHFLVANALGPDKLDVAHYRALRDLVKRAVVFLCYSSILFSRQAGARRTADVDQPKSRPSRLDAEGRDSTMHR